MKKIPVWLVDLLIPRRFLEHLNREVMDLYDEDTDIDQAEEAEDQETNEQEAADEAQPPA